MTELLANPFALDAIGQTGEERPFEVTAQAVRAYAEATDDNRRRPGRAHRAAGVRHPACLGDDRPRVTLHRLG